jgi:extradiol dioxygenase family protein
MGFVRATIAKSLLANGENLQAHIDGRQLEYKVTSTDDSWVYYFSYSHSTHQISMHIEAETTEPSLQPVGNEIVLITIVAVFGVILGVLVYSFSHRGRQETV